VGAPSSFKRALYPANSGAGRRRASLSALSRRRGEPARVPPRWVLAVVRSASRSASKLSHHSGGRSSSRRRTQTRARSPDAVRSRAPSPARRRWALQTRTPNRPSFAMNPVASPRGQSERPTRPITWIAPAGPAATTRTRRLQWQVHPRLPTPSRAVPHRSRDVQIRRWSTHRRTPLAAVDDIRPFAKSHRRIEGPKVRTGRQDGNLYASPISGKYREIVGILRCIVACQLLHGQYIGFLENCQCAPCGRQCVLC